MSFRGKVMGQHLHRDMQGDPDHNHCSRMGLSPRSGPDGSAPAQKWHALVDQLDMEFLFGFLDGSEQLSATAAQNRRENRKGIPSSWSTRAFTVGGGAISLGSDRGLNHWCLYFKIRASSFQSTDSPIHLGLIHNNTY